MGRPSFPRQSGASAYQTILGSNLCALWHCGSGISLSSGLVTQWSDIVHGIPLTPPLTINRPTYAADGSYFRGKNVVQCAKANYGGLQIVAGIGYGISSSDLGYIFVVGRSRVDPSGADYDHIIEVVNYASSAKSRILISQAATPTHGYQYWCTVSGTNCGGFYSELGVQAHLFEGSMTAFTPTTAVRIETWVDGVLATDYNNNVGPPNAPGTFDTIRLGVDATLPRGSEFSYALVGYCSNPITAEQRAVLYALASSDFGLVPSVPLTYDGDHAQLTYDFDHANLTSI
jgi:hypothetical protein